MKNVVLVFLGGGLGSVLRYGTGLFLPSKFPWATLLVNVLASFVLGLWAGSQPSSALRLLVAVGFCGGLSTFSTFSNDSLQLLGSQEVFIFLVNVMLNIGLCLLAVWAGTTLAR